MDTAVKISSFAAPTPEDIAAFEQLTPGEQQALIRAELDKGFDGTPAPLTDHTSKDIFAKAMARVAKSRAPR